MSQPKPVKNQERPTWDRVIEDDLAPREAWSVITDVSIRDREGAQKYGVHHQPFNGRDTLRDAYEEAMDLVCYLKAVILELPPVVPPSLERRMLTRLYTQAVDMLCSLKDYQEWKGLLGQMGDHQPDIKEASRELTPKKPQPEPEKPQDPMYPLWDKMKKSYGIVPDATGQPESATQAVPQVFQWEAHTGHPVTFQGDSSLQVANMANVTVVIEGEGEGWKKLMDASLEAERKKYHETTREGGIDVQQSKP
jgi:hypothetical protein